MHRASATDSNTGSGYGAYKRLWLLTSGKCLPWDLYRSVPVTDGQQTMTRSPSLAVCE